MGSRRQLPRLIPTPILRSLLNPLILAHLGSLTPLRPPPRPLPAPNLPCPRHARPPRLALQLWENLRQPPDKQRAAAIRVRAGRKRVVFWRRRARYPAEEGQRLAHLVH